MNKVVNAIILNDTKSKVLLIKRSSDEKKHAGKWAFPGGIVEKNENEESALKREVKEEIGLELKKIIRKIAEYDYEREGQKVKGESYLIEVESFDIKTNEEIEDFKWASIEDFEKLDCVDGVEEEAMKALFR
jgi:mutator protein MutT